MSEHDHAILQALVIECNETLFKHYGVEVRHAPGVAASEIWEEDLVLAGLIGFTSDEMRGSMIIAAGKTPLHGLDQEPTRHRDWIQELANQLLGRVKNRLLGYGVDITMTTPLSMRGLHLVLEPGTQESNLLLFRTAEGGAVCVLFDVEAVSGFELTKTDAPEATCPDEGELLLF